MWQIDVEWGLDGVERDVIWVSRQRSSVWFCTVNSSRCTLFPGRRSREFSGDTADEVEMARLARGASTELLKSAVKSSPEQSSSRATPSEVRSKGRTISGGSEEHLSKHDLESAQLEARRTTGGVLPPERTKSGDISSPPSGGTMDEDTPSPRDSDRSDPKWTMGQLKASLRAQRAPVSSEKPLPTRYASRRRKVALQRTFGHFTRGHHHPPFAKDSRSRSITRSQTQSPSSMQQRSRSKERGGGTATATSSSSLPPSGGRGTPTRAGGRSPVSGPRGPPRGSSSRGGTPSGSRSAASLERRSSKDHDPGAKSPKSSFLAEALIGGASRHGGSRDVQRRKTLGVNTSDPLGAPPIGIRSATLEASASTKDLNGRWVPRRHRLPSVKRAMEFSAIDKAVPDVFKW